MNEYESARRTADETVRRARLAERLGRLAADGRTNAPLWEAHDFAPAAELPNPDDVLSIDVRANVDVLLTCGGPTVFVRYVFSVAEGDAPDFLYAEWHTTDNAEGRYVVVRLDDDDAHTLADAYAFGVDALAERAAGPNFG